MKPLLRPERIGRLLVSALLLWLIWGGWKGRGTPAEEGPVLVTSRAALDSLPIGREFLVEGIVQPVPGEATTAWRGRFVFEQADRRRDDAGVRLRHVIREARPPVRFSAGWGAWTLPERSYALYRAPEVGPQPWHAWNQENSGFRPGDAAVARGRIRAPSTPAFVALSEGPLAAYRDRVARGETSRSLLVTGFRVLFSLFVVAFGVSAFDLRRRSAA